MDHFLTGMRDRDLVRVVEHCSGESGKQLAWIKNRIKLRSASTLASTPPQRFERLTREPGVPNDP